ncbi:hypothetical protein EWM64_g714 [Hericium alpestre]|uniref:ubiquitinyl hydrolase 1 n=1 Tax=Hericium alpestre TaxID=135208 RepID=A0A4Z0A9T5_9AGAM|nr:hypothetical protein EWM64_g714 [Hericium alpestre]
MSFRCEHCGTENNEVQMAGQIRPEGTMYTARILARSDLDRQVVKSETSTVIIPEYELTIPPSKGQLTTVEGIIRDVVRDLSLDQPLRRIQDEPTYTKIQSLIDKLRLILADDVDEEAEENKNEIGEVKTASASQSDKPMPAFTIKIDDPAGNSFIEFKENMADPKWNLRMYHRTREQNVALGLVAADEQTDSAEAQVSGNQDAQSKGDEAGREFAVGPDGRSEEIFEFPGDVIIMSTNCERCGYRDNEIKSGTAISEKGTRITLKVEDTEDLSRDLLKSETAGLTVPEINLVLQPGTLGGRFTTLEGILDQIYEELSEKAFVTGDSGTTDAFESFLAKLKLIKNVEKPFTLILDDPLSNSHLQNPYAPDPDPNMTVLNAWANKAGLIPSDAQFTDVYGLDDELLAMVPQPVKAVVLLFPIRGALKTARKAEDERLRAEGQVPIDPTLIWIKQTISNACGTMGLLHSLMNSNVAIAPESPLAKFIDEAKGKTPEERAHLLETTPLFADIHADAASSGQTAPPENLDTDLHFTCFVQAPTASARETQTETGEMRIIELDGDRDGPIDRGKSTDFLKDVAAYIRDHVIPQSPSLELSMVALAAPLD